MAQSPIKPGLYCDFFYFFITCQLGRTDKNYKCQKQTCCCVVLSDRLQTLIRTPWDLVLYNSVIKYSIED